MQRRLDAALAELDAAVAERDDRREASFALAELQGQLDAAHAEREALQGKLGEAERTLGKLDAEAERTLEKLDAAGRDGFQFAPPRALLALPSQRRAQQREIVSAAEAHAEKAAAELARVEAAIQEATKAKDTMQSLNDRKEDCVKRAKQACEK